MDVFIDLGMSPLANSYLSRAELRQPERFYPLVAYVCDECYLVQLDEHAHPDEIFSHYAYFSSYSDSWVRHAEDYVETAVGRWNLGATSLVVEIASNDGYLLQFFVRRGIPVLGIEPAANCAQAAEKKGIRTLVRFFDDALAREFVTAGTQADLIVGNNVLAHVPALNDFVRGLKRLLRPGGVITMEFPHLMRLIEENQFDTIYHEHFSYFSLHTVTRVFENQGLFVFDVDELPTHGGSLRIYVGHEPPSRRPFTSQVEELLAREDRAGLRDRARYREFASGIHAIKRELLRFLLAAAEEGSRVVGYGAPAKGNTLLNYCGIGRDLVQFTVDRSPHKQGCFLPGTHIPILAPEALREARPEYVLLLPWNLEREIVGQLSYVREWGGRFVIPIPHLRVYP